MKKNGRKSSVKITLALIGTMALARCGGEDGYRNIYRTMADCRADWGMSGGCEDIMSDSPDYHTGRVYGPYRSYRSRVGTHSSYRSAGIAAVSRGGFGSSSSFHSSSGRS